ncbi:MAG: CBS domain-containing protein [Anaerolineae bacterium]|nr:CBS domain-containing protein [Anaerolineae bacterium]NIQ82096.1 CBS domain-containing protein [Anaerolineae bacterium]
MMITEACVGECMKRRVVTVTGSTTVQEAARLVVDEHIGTLPVVDEEGMLTGVVRLHDLLGVFMPDFVALLDNIDFVRDFGALEQVEPEDVPEAAELTMSDLAVPPVSREEDSGLMRALATIVKHQLQDLPIVDNEGRLVGIASRVDIASAFFAAWTREKTSP